MAQLTKISMLSGKEHTIEIPLTADEIIAGVKRCNNGEHIQNVFSQLTPAQREFIMTGITDEEWTEAFPEEDEEGFDQEAVDSGCY